MKHINNKGFTLIELLVVIGIIGILAVIAIPNFMNFQAKAKQSEAKMGLSGLYTAEKGFYAEYGMYTGALYSVGYAPDAANRYYWTGFLANGCNAGIAMPAQPAAGFLPANAPPNAPPANLISAPAINNPAPYAANNPTHTTSNSPNAGLVGNCGAAGAYGFTRGANTFDAGAAGIVKANPVAGGGSTDEWHINETRLMSNRRNGV